MRLRFALSVPLLAAAAFAQSPLHTSFDAPVLRTDATDNVELSGDVDNDGDQDLIAFTAVGQSAIKTAFRVYSNDGSGNLTPGTAIPIPADSGTHTALGDVNGDGLVDLLVSSLTTSPVGAGLWLFAGAGGGTFAAPAHTPFAGNVYRLYLGDADADARLDVLALHFGTFIDVHMTWLAGSGAGLAQLSSTPAGNLALGDAAVLHIDGDGRADLAVAESVGSGFVMRFLRTTATGMALLGSLPLNPGFALDLVPGDWDLDGDDDLLISSVSGTSQVTLTRLLNQGAFVFTTSASQVLSGLTIGRLFAGDLDLDGDLDLLARGLSSSTPNYSLARVRNDSGTFTFARFRTVPQAAISFGAGLVDLDGDSLVDFADAKSQWFSTGNLTVPDRPESTSLRDWDDDGDLDSVQVQVLRRHDGAGTFAQVPGFWPVAAPNQFYIEPLNVGDFDGDGAAEVVVPWIQQIFLQQTFLGMKRLEANGDDQLVDQGAAAALPLRMNQGVTEDLDGDGDQDVLDSQGAWLNDGTGVFTLLPMSLQGFRPMTAGDVDGDGDRDFLAVNQFGPPATAVLLRSNPLSYTVVVVSPVQGGSIDFQSAVLFDLDDDGDLDVACRDRSSTNQLRTLVFENQGGALLQVLTLPQHGRVAAGDVDLDGRTDLVVFGGLEVHVLRRLPGTLAYAAPVTFAFNGPVDLADLDQDGDLDFVGSATLLSELVPQVAAGLRRQYGQGGLGLDARRPLLSALGPIRSGQLLTMRARRALGGTFGVLVFSNGPANVPNVLPGLTAYVASIDAEFGLILGGTPGQAGIGAIDATFQLPPGTTGVTVFAQFVALDAAAPSGLAHSNGVELRIGQ